MAGRRRLPAPLTGRNMNKKRLAVIADDFTGALDTGIQFAKKGIRIEVLSGCADRIGDVGTDVEVLVFDTQSRHIPPEEAYRAVYKVVEESIAAGFHYIYKKTDSGMRGNIGAELAAAMDASGVDSLQFFPALPKAGRITRGGIQLIDGVPVNESVFGKDPFNPVRHAAVRDIIAETSDVKVTEGHGGCGICVYDAESDEDFKKLGSTLGDEELRLTAGNAGFAEFLSPLIGLIERKTEYSLDSGKLLIVSGSINRITLDQMDKGEAAGYPRITLTGESKVREDYFSSGCGDGILQESLGNRVAIIDVGDPEKDAASLSYAREHGIPQEELWIPISRNLGGLIKRAVELDREVNILCIGGDTLHEALKAMEVSRIIPMDEVLQGVVLNRMKYRGRNVFLLSKSGGFGPEDLVCRLQEIIEKLSHKGGEQ